MPVHSSTCEQGLTMRAIAGDVDAFGQLISTRRAWMVDHAERLLRNHAAAEDVTQRACLRAWTFIHDLREPKLFGMWLRRILTTEAYRYSKASRWLVPVAEPIDRPSPAPQPDRQLAACEDLARVKAELATVDPATLAAFLGVTVDGMRYEDAGERDGLRYNVLRTRFHRLRARLRAAVA